MRFTNVESPVRSLAAYAAAGVVATVPMSMVMLVGGATGRMGTPPPRRIVDEAVERAPGEAPSSGTRDAAATALHFALGSVVAVGVAPFLMLLRRVTPAPLRASLAGASFGTAVYAMNYAGLAPALGILPPPTRDRPGRQPTMLAAHLVYGVVVAALAQVFGRGATRDELSASSVGGRARS
jgi:hypothetical protein